MLNVYGNGLANGFAAEDFNMIALSTVDWARLCRFLIEVPRINPMPLLLNRAIYPLFGTNPVGYHLMSLVLHGASTWCVVQLGILLSGKRHVGLVAGLLFAVYLRHHEAVLWLAANQFVIVALFGLVALVCFGKYLDGSQCRYYLITWVCSLLALAVMVDAVFRWSEQQPKDILIASLAEEANRLPTFSKLYPLDCLAKPTSNGRGRDATTRWDSAEIRRGA